jgi:hypothetical protein
MSEEFLEFGEVPLGFKRINAFVRDESTKKSKGAARTARYAEKQKEAMRVREYVPAQLAEIGKTIGWEDVVRLGSIVERLRNLVGWRALIAWSLYNALLRISHTNEDRR